MVVILLIDGILLGEENAHFESETARPQAVAASNLVEVRGSLMEAGSNLVEVESSLVEARNNLVEVGSSLVEAGSNLVQVRRLVEAESNVM